MMASQLTQVTPYLHESGTGMAFTLYEFFADQVEDKAIGGLPLAVLSTCTCLPSPNEHYICLILRLPTYRKAVWSIVLSQQLGFIIILKLLLYVRP